jgi:hypothetical protein
MTDDIVKRLREHVDCSQQVLCYAPRRGPGRLSHEAADEIERLREALQEMAWKDEKKTGYEHMTPETVQAIRDTCSTPASRVGKTQSEVFKEEDTP